MAGEHFGALQGAGSEVASHNVLRPTHSRCLPGEAAVLIGACREGSHGCLPFLPQHNPRPEAAAAVEARAASADQKVARLEELAHTLQREVAAKGAALSRMEEQVRLGGEGLRSFVQARVASMRDSLRRRGLHPCMAAYAGSDAVVHPTAREAAYADCCRWSRTEGGGGQAGGSQPGICHGGCCAAGT